MTTLSTSFHRLVRGRHVYGNASGTQELHLLLRLPLEEHEDKHKERQRAKLVQSGMYIACGSIQRKRNLLYKTSAHKSYDSDQTKLYANFQKDAQFSVRRISFRGYAIQQC